jgi:hypothetical protein
LNNENTIKKITPLARFLQLVPIIPPQPAKQCNAKETKPNW